MFRWLMVCCLFLFCAGCAASTVTISPESDQEFATVLGQIDRSEGLFNWRSFVLLAVDDKAVSHGRMTDKRDTIVKVPAGDRQFVVQAGFNTGAFSAGPRETIVQFTAHVEANKNYRINGAVRENLYLVWLEDLESGKKVSSGASGAYSTTESNGLRFWNRMRAN